MLIWHSVHSKAAGDIQAPYVFPSCDSSSPPALIWLLVPNGLTPLQEGVGCVCVSCPPGRHTIFFFMAKGRADRVLLHDSYLC